jgi:hypothetical protein
MVGRAVRTEQSRCTSDDPVSRQDWFGLLRLVEAAIAAGSIATRNTKHVVTTHAAPLLSSIGLTAVTAQNRTPI